MHRNEIPLAQLSHPWCREQSHTFQLPLLLPLPLCPSSLFSNSSLLSWAQLATALGWRGWDGWERECLVLPSSDLQTSLIGESLLGRVVGWWEKVSREVSSTAGEVGGKHCRQVPFPLKALSIYNMVFSAQSSSSCNYWDAPLVAKNSHCAELLTQPLPLTKSGTSADFVWHGLFSVSPHASRKHLCSHRAA